jgi:hypothetical protein
LNEASLILDLVCRVVKMDRFVIFYFPTIPISFLKLTSGTRP